MFRVLTVSASLSLISFTAFAGGHESYSGNIQFANANAFNLSKQVLAINAKHTGDITQSTGADATATNKSKCGCKGSQIANASAKNVSLQTAYVTAKYSGDITQISGASATATNIKSGGRY
jgi:hypothetical protein